MPIALSPFGAMPPLAAVRAFESAARHLSFTRAAEELAMTQAAVSYQIKVLEERVGSPLFVRQARQVALTETGQVLARAATDAFRILSEGYETARGGGLATLSISTIPTFAANWLALHLGSFQIAHPGIAVRLDTSTRTVDLVQEGFDIGIRTSGSGQWPGLRSHHLLRADFTPMLSPALAASIGGLKEPADILKLPIIGPGDPWWRIWFAAGGVDAAANLAARPDNKLGSQAFEGRAAVGGSGVAILTKALFAEELANGSLIQPFDLVGDDGHAYWLVYQEQRRNTPKIRAFRDWILKEIGVATGGT
ncbi:LysR substrate-binding domain-containing protein [Mesorhizobium sp. LHD-90]|uniref:LysR substrate-binding domain-containing protein n=1 Tax=Mesorhizobium sp. LHD-90 TaxID=3071414 RepID=UPI0027E025F5|nr:LysR substrate-binding domain-containing protein [Mesorhizobium sp. LHD-90]MDQ6435831.1 LysR substrate-binding domain-containing protein [Mesorhizobium sp. LHD-90]